MSYPSSYRKSQYRAHGDEATRELSRNCYDRNYLSQKKVNRGKQRFDCKTTFMHAANTRRPRNISVIFPIAENFPSLTTNSSTIILKRNKHIDDSDTVNVTPSQRIPSPVLPPVIIPFCFVRYQLSPPVIVNEILAR